MTATIVAGLGFAPTAIATRFAFRDRHAGHPLILVDYSGVAGRYVERRAAAWAASRMAEYVDTSERRRPVGLYGYLPGAAGDLALRAVMAVISRSVGTVLNPSQIDNVVAIARRLAEAAVQGQRCAPTLLDIFRAVTGEPAGICAPGIFADQSTSASKEAIAEALQKALRFPAVFLASVAPNRPPLSGMPRPGSVTWVDIKRSHQEPTESTILAGLAHAAAFTLIGTSACLDASSSPARPLLVLIDPPTELASHIGTKAIAALADLVIACPWSAPRSGRTPMPWLTEATDLWLVGEGTLPAHYSGRDHARDRAPLGPSELWVIPAKTTGRRSRAFRISAPVDGSTPIDIARRRIGAVHRPLHLSSIAVAAEESTHIEPRARDLIGRLASIDTLRCGWTRTRPANPDYQGCDGVTARCFSWRLESELRQLADELSKGVYWPKPLLRTTIPKPDGSARHLALPTIRDRVVQTAFLNLVEPLFEADFSDRSFAFRAARNAHQAVGMALGLARNGLSWAVKTDVEKCFDSLDHGILLRLFSAKIADPAMLEVLARWLRAEVLVCGEPTSNDIGVSQGASLSPFLANVYLTPLDRHLERSGIEFIRYADDLMVASESEHAAQQALQTIRGFLTDALRLSLKASKTVIRRFADGVELLGFRLIGREVTIAPGKINRILESLTGVLRRCAGATDGLAIERQLHLLSSTVRSLKSYFRISDAGETLFRQLQWLDAALDRAGESTLGTATREHPLWKARARFDDAGDLDRVSLATKTLAAAHPTGYADPPATASVPQVLSPEPGRPDIKSTNVTVDPQDTAAEDEADGVFLMDGGRLTVLQDGCHITVRGTDIAVLRKRNELARIPLGSVACLLLQGHGTSIASIVPLRLAEIGATLVIASSTATRVLALSSAGAGKAALRAEQARRTDDPLIVRAGMSMLQAKVSNQASLLRYFARYRKNNDPKLFADLLAAAAEIRREATAIKSIDCEVEGQPRGRIRQRAMGHEGRAASLYWAAVARLVPTTLGFPGRRPRNAEDGVNHCLNYAYGILYAEVWRALTGAGLDPCFGILHGSDSGEAGLVFDFIEELRAPYADRVVLSLCGRGFEPAMRLGSRLRLRSRRVLSRAFEALAERPVSWRGRDVTLRQILAHQAAELAKLFRGRTKAYHAFHLRW